MVNFFVKFLSEPTVVLGLVAMIGLIAMKNRPSTVIQGTMKTMLGFLILSAGSSLIASALTPFSTMFNAAFGMSGVVPEDNALVAAVQTVLGFETPMIMLLSFVINIILARITPFKYIFLTGHMMFSFAGTMAIVLDQMGINGWMAVAIGSVVQGICMVVFPAIAQPYTRKILKTDEVAFGFWGSSLIVFSGFVGRLVRKKNRDEETDTWEKVKVSNKLDFLKDMSILMSIVMIVVYIFTALMAGTEVVSELAGGQNIIVYAVIQAMTFVAGVLVLALIKSLISHGYADQLLISGDMGRASYLEGYGGGPGFRYIKTKFIPRLLDEGVDEDVIHKIFVENPKRWLAVY